MSPFGATRRTGPTDDRPPARHPLLDSVGDGSVRIESRAAVVRLGRAQADLLGRAADVGARPILVTDGLSVVTEAFRQALLDAGGAWVVRGDDGLRNGLDGRRLDAFPDAAETVLGTTSELLATELAGAAPTGWGTHEPAGRPWDRRTLTEAARDRMPDPTRFVVVGSAAAPVAFTVTAQRTDQGVEELTTGLLSVGAPGDAAAAARVEAVPQVLGRLAATQLPLFALVLRRPGRADLAQAPRMPFPPVPVAVLLGAPAIRQLGLDPAVMRDRFGAVVAGKPRIPALVLPFGRHRDRSPVEELRDLVEHVGQDRVADAVGMDESTREQVRRATEQ